MSSFLSLRTCWLPRTVCFQKTFFRSTLSTTTTSDNTPPPYRSASRFSLKIARFLFSKRRIKHANSTTTTAVPLSTYVHYSKSESVEDMHEIARSFVLSLEPDHRQILRDELTEVEKLSDSKTESIQVLPSQLAVVFLETGIPYIGFGFVDNFVMLVAGETIETFFGAAFCLSTMAAAGLGNAVSDVMGIGLADRIERMCGRILAVFGISSPKLTTAQWNLRSVHRTQLMSKLICIFVGCLLGMCPLLFRDNSSDKNKSAEKHKD